MCALFLYFALLVINNALNVIFFTAQSLYKLNSSVDDGVGINDPMKSPILKGQPSPIGSDIISPHHVSILINRYRDNWILSAR